MFLKQQAHTAEEALDQAFAPSSRPDDVLFYLPITKAWLRQLVLGLVLICQSSTRGVVDLPIPSWADHEVVPSGKAPVWIDHGNVNPRTPTMILDSLSQSIG